MKQIEATKERPFYSVCYQYECNPYTLWSENHFHGKRGTTMQGTDSLQQAEKTALRSVNQPGVNMAMIHVSHDCYNHKEVCRFERDKNGIVTKTVTKPVSEILN